MGRTPPQDGGAKTLASRGHVKFDAVTDEAFRERVIQALNDSDGIKATTAESGIADVTIHEVTYDSAGSADVLDDDRVSVDSTTTDAQRRAARGFVRDLDHVSGVSDIVVSPLGVSLYAEDGAVESVDQVADNREFQKTPCQYMSDEDALFLPYGYPEDI